MGKDWLFETPKCQNLWMNNEVRGDQKMQFVCIFYHFCRKFEFL